MLILPGGRPYPLRQALLISCFTDFFGTKISFFFPLRQHALLDETEAAAAVCMLHHINLLQLVRDRAATGAK